jgi:serine/threonine protein kinase HipA of HipAB toxin-antitoxin module
LRCKVKNISFLMVARGSWSLAPAYDLTYGYDPGISLIALGFGAAEPHDFRPLNFPRNSSEPSPLEAF